MTQEPVTQKPSGYTLTLTEAAEANQLARAIERAAVPSQRCVDV